MKYKMSMTPTFPGLTTVVAANDNLRFDPDAMREQAGAASRLLRVLANSQRLRLLCLLVDGEATVAQLNRQLPELSQSALSQHLARLRREKIVETRRESQQIWYRLAAGPAILLVATLHDIYCVAPQLGVADEPAAATPDRHPE